MMNERLKRRFCSSLVRSVLRLLRKVTRVTGTAMTSNQRGGNFPIAVELRNDVAQKLWSIGITRELMVRAVNNRHRGLVTELNDRLVCIHWLDESAAILIDALISKKRTDETTITIIAVSPQLGLWLAPKLPAGSIRKKTDLHKVMRIVADSFGSRVSMDAHRKPQYLYYGVGDGKIRVESAVPGEEHYTCSTRRSDGTWELGWCVNYDKYLRWYTTHLRQHIQDRRAIKTPRDLQRAQQVFLERLFPKGWFASNRQPNHPARLAWNACEEVARTDGLVQLDLDAASARQMLHTMLTGMHFAHVTRGSADDYQIGTLEAYGDELVIRRLRKEVQSPSGFASVLVEVSCAARHIDRGHEAVPSQDSGMPDIAIKIPMWERVVYAECKRVDRSSGDARFQQVIRKANSQIKARGLGNYGIVYIDISDRVDRHAPGDEIPAAVLDTVEIVKGLLRGEFFSAVSAVILLWEKVAIRGDPAADAITLAALSRRNVVIRHPEPTVPLPQDVSPLLVESAATITILPLGGQAPA